MIRRIKILLFAAAWLLLPGTEAGAEVDVGAASRIDLSGRIEWCRSSPAQGIEAIATGSCGFSKGRGSELARGFSNDAFWLRFSLHNPADTAIERWLRIGHPRLQHLSLFEPDGSGRWLRTDTGIHVPVAFTPVLSAYPLLPVRLKAGESRTFYVRVESQTSIDLTGDLWEPFAFQNFQHGRELAQMLPVGGLLLALVFALIVFFKTGEKAALYFGLSMLAAIVQDLSYTGLLRFYLWPPTLPFPMQLLGPMIGVCLCLFVLFAREFLSIRGVGGRLGAALLGFTGLLLASMFWTFFGNYGDAVRLLPLAGVGVVVVIFTMFFRAWRNGSKPAGYLTLSYGILTTMLIYRVVVAYGGLQHSFIISMGFSWYFVLIAPLILAGLLKRSEEMRYALLQSHADADARVTFMAKMSHEFRSPLNTILGYAELQARGIQSSTTDPAAEIKRSGRHLLSMIDEILEHSRGEAGQVRLESAPVVVADFMASIGDSAEMMMQGQSGNTFRLIQTGEMPAAVLVDERRLRQVIDNLLSNANRYTRQGSISLTCNGEVIDAHRCRLDFSVSDTGVGIAPEEVKKVFQPFTRGTAGQSSGIDGAGMGLAIVQQLVGLMGGTVKVESQPGQGSTFSFSIACARSAPEQAAINQSSSHSMLPRPCKILIVDDDPHNLNLLDLILTDCGFDVVMASSGQAARQYFDDPIELVITDQFMADGDGWSLLQEWSTHAVPVILLSAAAPQRPIGLATNYQFRHSLLKPCDPDVLIATIGHVLGIDYLPRPQPVSALQVSHALPPHEMLIPLRAMIDAGAVTDICTWLAQFGQVHPEHHEFSKQAITACRELDFDSLRHWTTPL